MSNSSYRIYENHSKFYIWQNDEGTKIWISSLLELIVITFTSDDKDNENDVETLH